MSLQLGRDVLWMFDVHSEKQEVREEEENKEHAKGEEKRDTGYNLMGPGYETCTCKPRVGTRDG
jgi:hypothetical protein